MPDTKGTVEIRNASVIQKFSPKRGSGVLPEFIAMAATFENTWVDAARSMSDFALSDLPEQRFGMTLATSKVMLTVRLCHRTTVGSAAATDTPASVEDETPARVSPAVRQFHLLLLPGRKSRELRDTFGHWRRKKFWNRCPDDGQGHDLNRVSDPKSRAKSPAAKILVPRSQALPGNEGGRGGTSGHAGKRCGGRRPCYSTLVTPGTGTGYLPSASGRMGGVASQA